MSRTNCMFSDDDGFQPENQEPSGSNQRKDAPHRLVRKRRNQKSCLSTVGPGEGNGDTYYNIYRLLKFLAPPEHQFETDTIGVRAGNPVGQQIVFRLKPLEQFFAGGSEWRAVLVRDQVIHSEIVSSRLEPLAQGPNIFLSLIRLDRAEERVFEDPVKWLLRRIMQKVTELKVCRQTGGLGFLGCQSDGAGSDIVAICIEARRSP